MHNYGSAGQGSSWTLSTADYQRHGDLSPFVKNIQGVKDMSGTNHYMDWPITGKIDSTSSITAAITFTPLSDSTISYLGVLDSGVLYYKKVNDANHMVIWQTHHYGNSASTLTYNYSNNQFVFEQLDEWKNKKHHIQLQ